MAQVCIAGSVDRQAATTIVREVVLQLDEAECLEHGRDVHGKSTSEAWAKSIPTAHRILC
jgi:hypothetical protein